MRQFNLSLLITDEFMQAVRENSEWKLAFPLTQEEVDQEGIDLFDEDKVVWRDWPVNGRYISSGAGLVACRVYQTIQARRLWDVIMSSTYDFAEPGFVLIDRVNEMNNNWWVENIRATNPCGEQPLPPYGSCLLGSVNLTKFVLNAFDEKASFDWEEFRRVVKVFTRMLDNVVEINGLPLARATRRDQAQAPAWHGVSRAGLDDHDDAHEIRLARVGSFHRARGPRAGGGGLGDGSGTGPRKRPGADHDRGVHRYAGNAAQAPGNARGRLAQRRRIPGRVLHARYSRYMQRVAEIAPDLVEELAETGARFTHHSSIAPTGTISLSLANNASNGIEPSFAHHYFRNVIREGKKSKEKVDVFSFELLAYRELVNEKAEPRSDRPGSQLPEYFITADDVQPREHVDIQAAAQKWVDSSISKTANVPTDFPYEEFKDIYLYAHEKGLKGCTTFRFNPEAFQGVLVKEDDLKNTTYRFRWKTARRSICAAMRKWNTTARFIRPPICSMRSRRAITASFRLTRRPPDVTCTPVDANLDGLPGSPRRRPRNQATRQLVQTRQEPEARPHRQGERECQRLRSAER